jgi:hypothetical protein
MTPPTTQEQRRYHVTQMNANLAIEDMRPDATDLALQARYIGGTASLDDLLQHARDVAQQPHTKA